MHFRLPHLVDHGIDGRCRELIDKDGIVMMRISVDFRIQRITEEQRLIIKIDLDIHKQRINRKIRAKFYLFLHHG
jgi:hypothetical protein